MTLDDDAHVQQTPVSSSSVERARMRKTAKAMPTPAPNPAVPRVFPFAAIAGQEELKQALLLCAVDPSIGGVLALGDRGTGKSTAVRALAHLLPPIRVVAGCGYGCDPDAPSGACLDCAGKKSEQREVRQAPVPMVDLPLGATEDRVIGALDIERALVDGVKVFQPGLLARANRGFLYIDEVNLLEDHLVDLLIDVAASGENVVEREGLSVRHPARFVLVGSGNPEEGELRPQLLDRFGLSVDVRTPTDVETRVEIVERRDAFERDPAAFNMKWQGEQGRLCASITAARNRLKTTDAPKAVLRRAAELCIAAGTDGLRGEITLMRAARALAALDGHAVASDLHLKRVAPLCLSHRLRRAPLDEASASARVARAIADVFK